MGALQVMQEVGKEWQSMTQDARKYFKDKADRDKVRYLNEQRAFYDEVEKIGIRVGTVTTKDGQINVAAAISSMNNEKLKKSMSGGFGKAQISSQDPILQKRKSAQKTPPSSSTSQYLMQDSGMSKRQKVNDYQDFQAPPSQSGNKISMPMHNYNPGP
jgi:hypothetical protein